MQKLFTSKEVAEILQIDEETVRVYARKGLLPSIKLGNKLRFRQPNVEEFISASEYNPSNTVGGTKDLSGAIHTGSNSSEGSEEVAKVFANEKKTF